MDSALGRGSAMSAHVRAMKDALMPVRLHNQTRCASRGLHHAQVAIDFSASLMSSKRLVGQTAERAIRLEREILPRETAHFEGDSNYRLAIATGGRPLLFGFGHRRSKLGGAYWIRVQLMPQFQADIPDPLGYDVLCFLSPGRVTTPSVGISFAVFI